MEVASLAGVSQEAYCDFKLKKVSFNLIMSSFCLGKLIKIPENDSAWVEHGHTC